MNSSNLYQGVTQQQLDTALAGVPAHYPAALFVDLAAIAANYRKLATTGGGVACAAVVKADGYGLGAGQVATQLAAMGCSTFFVATPDEGVALRTRLGPVGAAREIYVLDGLLPGTEPLLTEHGLRPVLGSMEQIEAWAAWRAASGARLASAIHLDTGMNRLGLPGDEVETLIARPELVSASGAVLLISHLACADEAAHPLNARQLARFAQWRARLPALPASLANSAGVLLGPAYHSDLLRPGVALYGANPLTGSPNPMHPVVHLFARVLQIRDCSAGDSVGYGAAQRLQRPSRIATLGLGYADGFLRMASASDSRGGPLFHLEGIPVPVIGRVSMDLITIDITDVPAELARIGAWVEIIGSRTGVDEIAAQAGTIGYEVLTRLGKRFHRIYLAGARDQGAASAE